MNTAGWKAVLAAAVWFLVGGPANAATISLLGGAVTGTSAAGETIDLVVAYEPNGVVAGPLVSHQLSLGLSGLAVSDLQSPGSLYAPLDAADYFDLGCVGDVVDCPPVFDGVDAFALHLESFVIVMPGVTAQPQGTFFALRLTATGGDWSLDLFGDPDFSLYWEPPPTCDPLDDGCGFGPLPVPFLIVPAGDTSTPLGTAMVTVGLTRTPPDVDPPPPSVPEPALALFLFVGTLASLRRARRV